ncbi:MAG: NIPSNAP family protein [Betaproteobacteria bacterium]
MSGAMTDSTTNVVPRRLVEIRAYRLKPGTRAEFDAAVTERALPMVRAFGMDVVAHGPVANDENGYFLVRSFASVAELTAQEDEFYGSARWRDGPREALVSRIETCLDTLLWLSPSAIDDLRAGNGRALQAGA